MVSESIRDKTVLARWAAKGSQKNIPELRSLGNFKSKSTIFRQFITNPN